LAADYTLAPQKQMGFQMLVHAAAGELVTAAPQRSLPAEQTFATGMQALVQKLSEGNIAGFASLIGKHKTTVWGWLQESRIPFAEILTVTQRLGTSPIMIFKGETEIVGQIKSETYRSGDSVRRPASKPFNAVLVKARIEKFLTQDQPPRSMQQVAKELKYDKRLLYRHFPALCKNIAARVAVQRKSRIHSLARSRI
jgi:hypothetical protein